VALCRRALEQAPGNLLAGLTLAEALAALGQYRDAIEQARRTLSALERGARVSARQVASSYPAAFDTFRVEWERAGWAHAGDPQREAEAKHRLLWWKLHTLLARWTGDLAHAYEATLARPDLAETQATLGAALADSGRLDGAASHLVEALALNPFDGRAAAKLAQVLGQRGDGAGVEHLTRDRGLLARAAPDLLPPPSSSASIPSQLPASPTPPHRIVWEGPQRVLYSFAQVNRQICSCLAARGHELTLWADDARLGAPAALQFPPALVACIRRALSGPAPVNGLILQGANTIAPSRVKPISLPSGPDRTPSEPVPRRVVGRVERLGHPLQLI
jgi:tetratricopeptide (TPR) repeat protein